MDPREPGVPGRLGELGAHGGRDLGPEVVRCWSAHAGAPRVVHRRVHKCGEAVRSVDPSTPRPVPLAGGWGSSDARGRPGRRGRGRYQRRGEAHKGVIRGTVHTPRVGKRRPSGVFPRSTASGRPDCRASATTRTLHCPPARRACARTATTATRRQVPGTSVPRRPPGPIPSARAFEEAMREEDVSAEQPEAEEEARLPSPHADARRVAPRSVGVGPRAATRLSA